MFIDASTIDPFVSTGVGKSLKDKNSTWEFADAPVSGGVVGATNGTLTFMVGANQNIVPILEQILTLMGKRTIHCGQPGAGLSAKLTNNYLLALNNIASCEAMNLGLKLGLTAETLGEVINSSTGRCWPSAVNNPVKGIVPGAPVDRDYEGGFGTRLMRKDLLLAIGAAEKAGLKMDMSVPAAEIYKKAAEDDRYGPKDFSVLYKMFSENN